MAETDIHAVGYPKSDEDERLVQGYIQGSSELLKWVYTYVPAMIDCPISKAAILWATDGYVIISVIPDRQTTARGQRGNFDPIIPVPLYPDLAKHKRFVSVYSDLVWYMQDWIECRAKGLSTNPQYIARVESLMDRVFDEVWTETNMSEQTFRRFSNDLAFFARNPKLSYEWDMRG
jgi:hypothetical protein